MIFLKRLYDDVLDFTSSSDKVKEIYDSFIDYYGEENVDIQLDIDFNTFKESLYYTEVETIMPEVRNSTLLIDASLDVIKTLIKEYKNNKKKFLNTDIIYSCFDPFIINILVFFPKITVTNERDESIDIEEVYIKIPIDLRGRMFRSFSITRTKYSQLQYNCGYMHSHAPSGIYPDCTWKFMCLGSGPLCTTLHTLQNSYDIDIWKLFCVELEEYLKVESIMGVPYISLRSLTNREMYPYSQQVSLPHCEINHSLNNPITCDPILKDFYSILLSKLFDTPSMFVYNDSAISLACNYEQFVLYVSEQFIDYINNSHIKKGTLNKEDAQFRYLVSVKRNNKGRLMIAGARRNTPNRNIDFNTPYLVFKGENKYLKVTFETLKEDDILVLNSEIISFMLIYLIHIINYGTTEKDTSLYSEVPLFL